MKFTKAERVVHEVDYNPPCNYYDVDKSRNVEQIVFGSLAGPMIKNQNANTFGYSKRFAEAKSIKPGPSDYFSEKKRVVYNVHKDLTKPKQFLRPTGVNLHQKQENGYQNQASIPYRVICEENLDIQDKVFLKQLALMEDVHTAEKNTHKKQPAYSFSKGSRKIFPDSQKNLVKKASINSNGELVYQTFENTEVNDENSKLQNYNMERQAISKNSKKKLIVMNESLIKCAKKRSQAINNIGSDFVPSLELIEIMSKMRTKYVPGPGTYLKDTLKENIAQESLKEQKGSKIPSAKRFAIEKMSKVGPGSYDVDQKAVSTKQSSMGKEKRNLFNTDSRTDLEHRFYIDPSVQSKISLTTSSTPSKPINRSSSCSSIMQRKRINRDDLCNAFSDVHAFGSCNERFASISNEDDKLSKVTQRTMESSRVTDYEQSKKDRFKKQLKARAKNLKKQQNRKATQDDSGLLGISSMVASLQ